MSEFSDHMRRIFSNILLLLTVLLAFACAPPDANRIGQTQQALSPTYLDLFVGASDCRGFNVVSTLPTAIAAPYPAVQYAYDVSGYGLSGWGSLRKVSQEHAAEITFGHDRHDAGDELRILKRCRNGTTVKQWVQTHGPATITWAQARIAEAGTPLTLRAIFIDIGGGEAALSNPTAATNLENDYTALAAVFRTGFNAPDLFIGVHRLAEYLSLTTHPQRELVQESQEQFVASDSNAAITDPIGPAGSDSVHRSSAAQQSAGHLDAELLDEEPVDAGASDAPADAVGDAPADG